eukprot:7655750-Alexandrium_andersonii.AAC.1
MLCGRIGNLLGLVSKPGLQSGRGGQHLSLLRESGKRVEACVQGGSKHRPGLAQPRAKRENPGGRSRGPFVRHGRSEVVSCCPHPDVLVEAGRRRWAVVVVVV